MAKKKRQKYFFIKLLGLLVCAILLIYIAVKIVYKPSDIVYSGFGITVPAQYVIHGIDVSKYQRNINWKLVKEMRDQNKGLHFAFIKATQGIASVDPNFRQNWLNATDAGMSKGAYHYFRADQDAERQAKNFIQIVVLAAGDFPPVLDVEKAYGQNTADIQAGVITWLSLIEAHYNVKPIVYSGANFYKTYLQDICSDYPLWVAHYLRTEGEPRVERKWSFWQHSESGNVNGIEGRVDFNVFNGDFYELQRMKIR